MCNTESRERTLANMVELQTCSKHEVPNIVELNNNLSLFISCLNTGQNIYLNTEKKMKHQFIYAQKCHGNINTKTVPLAHYV